ncbi:MAG: Multidrug export protein EmrA [Steroidobacteraceae bacterium]|nr:Multidrug export protein EmrA [Steroidobacteraceae bacterium]
MKRWLRPVLLFGVPLAIVATAVWLWFTGGRFVTTDDAYVKADKVPVSVEVAGTLQKLLVRENQRVTPGEPLFTLDAAPYEVALAKATAALARARTEIAALKASYREQQAQIALSKTRVQFAEREYRRQADLAAKGYVSAINLDQAQEAVELDRQQTVALEHDLARIAASLGGGPDLPVEQHPDYLSAQAAVAQAQLDLARTTIRAPLAGVVTKLSKVGTWLAPGTPALALVGGEAPWVEANFTEKDLTHVRPGQPVDLRFDIYPGRHWRGVVDSISPATGAEFSVLPPQNATGNWIKVTQRIPVRIELAPQDDAPVLRAGLSAWVKIDTGHRR